MEYYDKEFCLEVWGPLACFTRPEFKVERVSYDVITPSATRAVFEAIFWKPAIRWQVTKIEVLNPIRWTTIRRNEVAAVSNSPIFIEEKRQQKNSLILRDVRYRIHAKLVFIPKRDRGNSDSKNPIIDREESDLLRTDENPGKYNAMFQRRAGKGQCFTQPYLGCREFSASFRLVDPATEALISPIPDSQDFGLMLYDIDFGHNQDKPDALFYRARMEHGVIVVPPIDSKEVLR
ncbi:MAG: type I-C CRISPR-associated protein Cas5 [Bacteroidales bacterium]|jgi:CRISPR-associated protein Cas5d|nr:type I-C CRISPR-associated protein Cas5 [Bacteroidales bacterium]